MDYWHDEYLDSVVDDFRRKRDPSLLNRLIHQKPEIMQSPAIGRLFLDMINDRLPKTQKPNSTALIRGAAVELVLFYIGAGIKITKAYSAAGAVIGKSGDTIKGYFLDWLDEFTIWGANDLITKAEFWANPEEFVGDNLAFRDGQAMVDEDLAMHDKPPHWSIERYRKELTAHYEDSTPINYDDPWETIEKISLLNQELQYLEDD